MTTKPFYTCIVIDDEPHVIEGLSRYIDMIPDLNLINSYMDPIKALLEISSLDSVDLIIMDIDMPDISGIELSKELRRKTKKLIFSTAHSKYGYEAFKVDADDYLLKPYTFAEFLISFNKLFPNHSNQTDRPQEIPEDFLFIKSKEDNLKLVKVRFDDIILIESQSNYVVVSTRDKTITSYMSLSEAADYLISKPSFIKFQRSFILNKAHIQSIQGTIIYMDNGKKVVIGDYYKKDFNEFVHKNLLKGRRGT